MKTTLKVTGMACMNCAGKVEKALKSLEGVHSVDITLDTGMVSVEAEDSISVSNLCDTIDATGFTVEK